jgi:hypothetical protein
VAILLDSAHALGTLQHHLGLLPLDGCGDRLGRGAAFPEGCTRIPGCCHSNTSTIPVLHVAASTSIVYHQTTNHHHPLPITYSGQYISVFCLFSFSSFRFSLFSCFPELLLSLCCCFAVLTLLFYCVWAVPSSSLGNI